MAVDSTIKSQTSSVWGVPDYSGKITISSASYTAPSNGYIKITANGTITDFTINGESFSVPPEKHTTNQSSKTEVISYMFPIGKNKIAKATRSFYKTVFIPVV